MPDSSPPIKNQLKVVLLAISPMIWRRLLVCSDSTIEKKHYTIQLAMGWSDIHLHHFIIHGKHYGVRKPGGEVFSDHASEVTLASFNWHRAEKFLYEYDFSISPARGVWLVD